jgi:hypothetical protein
MGKVIHSHKYRPSTLNSGDQPSTHAYSGLQDIDYPLHDKTIVVTRCGRICLGKKKINFSTVFAGQPWASKKCTTTSGW